MKVNATCNLRQSVTVDDFYMQLKRGFRFTVFMSVKANALYHGAVEGDVL